MATGGRGDLQACAALESGPTGDRLSPTFCRRRGAGPMKSKRCSMPERIPIFDQHGNYAGTLDPDTARCVWEQFGLYRDNCEYVQELFRLPDGRYALREVPMAFYDEPPHHYELVSAGEAVRIARNDGSGVTDEMYAIMLDDADKERHGANRPPEQPQAAGDCWHIEAHYVKNTADIRKIDRRWRHWGPATRPIKYDGLSDISDAANALDERLYEMPDGDYVLVWRADVYREYHECDYMPPKEAAAWFRKQGIEAPSELREHLTIGDVANGSVYVALWELSQRVTAALGGLNSEIGYLFDADGDRIYLGEDALAKVAAAALRLKECCAPCAGPTLTRGVGDVFTFPPRGTDGFVDAVTLISEETKRLIIEIGLSRANAFEFWKTLSRTLWRYGERLESEVSTLEALPELRDVVYAEALRKVQELQAQASRAGDEPPQVGEFVECPNGDIGIVEPLPDYPDEALAGFAARLSDFFSAPTETTAGRAEPAAEPQPTEAAVEGVASNPAAVESKPESKGAVKNDYTADDYNPVAAEYLELHQGELAENPFLLSDRKVAAFIRERLPGCRCSSSTASTLPIVKAFKEKRGPKPSRGPGKSPGKVSFTSKVEATVGRNDEALESLLNDHGADYEPSPLDDDPPGKPWRVKADHNV